MLTLWAFAVPVDVHLDDGGFDATTLIGPGAIVFAAIVAALYARFNLREQLSHDREMREREESDAAVNHVVDEITKARIALDASKDAFDQLWTARAASLKFPGMSYLDDERKAEQALERLRDTHRELLTPGFRLSIRFHDEHPIVETFNRWRDTLGRLADAYGAVLDSGDLAFNDSVEVALSTRTELAEELLAFLKAARGRVHST